MDFADDLAGFAAQGEIGTRAAILTEPAAPDIGDEVRIICRGVQQGLLRSSLGESWPVNDGAQIQLVARRAIELWLVDRLGQQVARLRVEPRVLVPRLVAWGLPERADYASGELLFQPTFADTASAQLRWRPVGSADWRPLPGPAPFRIPLEPRDTEVELQASLRSRHAELHPLGTATFERRLRVTHPRPEWRLEAPAEVVRHQRASVTLACRWTQGARLSCGSATEVCMATGAQWLRATLLLPTQDCGVASIGIDLTALDGTVTREHRDLLVRPRPAGSDVWIDSTGLLHYELALAEAVALEVPETGQRVPLEGTCGAIELGQYPPRRLLLTFRNDAGAVLSDEISLDLSAQARQPLPAFGY